MPDPDAHVRHADSHGRPWPIGSWYCCGAVQLGVIGPDDCNECGEPWPCPSVTPPGADDCTCGHDHGVSTTTCDRCYWCQQETKP